MRIQSKSWNCGIFAAQHLLERFGIESDSLLLEKIAGSTEEDGTDHEGIRAIFEHYDLQWTEGSGYFGIDLPAVVNYADMGEGHYGILETIVKGKVNIWEPSRGEFLWFTIPEWDEIWFSERYIPIRWWLHPHLLQKAS